MSSTDRPTPTRRPTRPPFDPQSAPVVERGSAQDAIDPRLLDAEVLRAALRAPRAWSIEPTDEARWATGMVPTPAAVLVPLVVPEASAPLRVLLTKRTAHLYDHAGQISFPGGRVDEGDASREATALREAEEEVGLAASAIEIVGAMPDYLTGTGFIVTPVIGMIAGPFVVRPDPFEVAHVFEVPLDFLMNPANHEKRAVRWRDEQGEHERHFYAMPYRDAGETRFIWGATAAMLRNLYHLLRAQV